MIRLGVRLAVAGGREAVARLALIAVAVAIGVGLLLACLAGINAVHAQNDRYAWLESGAPSSSTPPAGVDPLWWQVSADYYQGRLIGHVDVAPTGPNSPLPPGIAALPGPGQMYASPSMVKLLRATPPDQLLARYGSTVIGTIGDDALPAPNTLLVVAGSTVAELSQQGHAQQISTISTVAPNVCNDNCAIGVGIDANGIILILAVVAAALLFPVLIFIGGATRLAAARREQRFAAMRLIGATPRQLTTISAVESALAAGAGVLAGFGLFFAVRPGLAAIPFTGAPFFTGDLSLGLPDVLAVAFGIPVAAAVAARVALRHAVASPLGVARRVTRKPPRAWRLLPLLAGLAELGSFAYVFDIGGSGHDTTMQTLAYLSGVLLVMTGLVVAGPWLTMRGARLLARRARRPATLIAGRRLADGPHAGFRAISGLVVAVFVGTAALAIITTIVAYDHGVTGDQQAARATLTQDFPFGHLPASVSTAPLASVPGVTGIAVVHSDSSPHDLGPGIAAVSCADVARVPVIGHCPAGAVAVQYAPGYGGGFLHRSTTSDLALPVAPYSATQLAALPVLTVVVGTDGSAGAVEHARTVMEGTYPSPWGPQTIAESRTRNQAEINSYRQLANVVILTSLPIAGCSLAVSLAGGLTERRRPFSLLRLTGTPMRVLRGVVALESAVPLLLSALVSASAGLLTAQLFLRAQLRETLQLPGPSYYVVVAAGLVGSLAVIASTLPLLRRITGPEAARNG